MTENSHIMMIAGESSGDHHGATLAQQLLAHDPTLQLTGVGGVHMQAAGVEIITDLTKNSVMGFLEVIKHARIFISAFRLVKKALKNNKPDLLILIDLPGFNLRLVKIAKRLGIKTLYYISPQLWAWKSGRIKIVRRCVDHMAVILPFEEAYYQQRNVAATYVGHPLATQVTTQLTKTEALAKFNLASDRLTIGLLPGSRHNEIKLLWKILLDTARKCHQQWPQTQFVVPLASTMTTDKLRAFGQWDDLPITFTTTDKYEAFQCIDIALSCSGTVTLELALLGIPMVIFYRCNPLSFMIAKRIVHIRHFGLCNILEDSERTVVPELIQEQVTAERLFSEVKRYVDDQRYYQKTRADLLAIRNKLLAVKPDKTLLAITQKLLLPTV